MGVLLALWDPQSITGWCGPVNRAPYPLPHPFSTDEGHPVGDSVDFRSLSFLHLALSLAPHQGCLPFLEPTAPPSPLLPPPASNTAQSGAKPGAGGGGGVLGVVVVG